jgi:hypothetical protein
LPAVLAAGRTMVGISTWSRFGASPACARAPCNTTKAISSKSSFFMGFPRE